MILMHQIFDVTANENARYKRNELEFFLTTFEISNATFNLLWLLFHLYLQISSDRRNDDIRFNTSDYSPLDKPRTITMRLYGRYVIIQLTTDSAYHTKALSIEYTGIFKATRFILCHLT